MKAISERIIDERKRQGLTQDALSEKAGISLRTVQRIEGRETTPRGHTLTALYSALGLELTENENSNKVENKNFFIGFHIAVVSGVIIPLGDLIIPFILWISNRDKIENLDKQGKNLLIFRVIYNLVMFISIVSTLALAMNGNLDELTIKTSKIFSLYIICHLVATFIYPTYIATSIYKSQVLKNYYPSFINLNKTTSKTK